MKYPEGFERERLGQDLVEFRKEWGNYLNRSYPSLRNHHGDLIQEATEDLLVFARDHQDAKIENWRGLAFSILRRRIADHFRSVARRWAESPLPDDLATAEPGADPERVAHFTLLLQRVVAFITELDEADRRLLLSGVWVEESSGTAKTDAERKRLSRLRTRLREELDK
jgi:DNA-directed RNA polymerase specialized sigma24 family protein